MLTDRVTTTVKRAGLATIRLRREIEQFADEQGLEYSVARKVIGDSVAVLGDPEFNAKTKAIAAAAGADWEALIDVLIAQVTQWLESCQG